ncbi:MAG: bifunctional demethylmenaquinone methyltransferase/2-methoxy-6-polyprenyl-1,4-benzoquinol methylase UbiE [Desulfobacula sp.]|jgi:demethylmenaquinone methyltransferase / 2-methoxy-6-polyprenyl-1,4-benzoquinol methylase|nr:bifunctional demethylmenaquinone methyltransferase/2-methoxy-6-polyprenyl-1,4-benzoquinol methylase UbiE [Desulfobacula sp.]
MDKELSFIKHMFDRIAPRYDYLNRLLSLKRDTFWRTQMVKAARLDKNNRVLDVACGTCDVALEASAQLKGRVHITGLDFSLNMLRLGKKKIPPDISLVNGDVLHLPFGPQSFDVVFIAFGIRNIMNRHKAVCEFFSILKKGGRLVVLELTTPDKGIFRSLYFLYFRRILPFIGSLFSKHSYAYQYLPDSVLNFPEPTEFAGIMENAGFTNVRFERMSLGIVTLFVGTKNFSSV